MVAYDCGRYVPRRICIYVRAIGSSIVVPRTSRSDNCTRRRNRYSRWGHLYMSLPIYLEPKRKRERGNRQRLKWQILRNINIIYVIYGVDCWWTKGSRFFFSHIQARAVEVFHKDYVSVRGSRSRWEKSRGSSTDKRDKDIITDICQSVCCKKGFYKCFTGFLLFIGFNLFIYELWKLIRDISVKNLY